jgi:glycosyltransferase involved in cell wall biosynthesis
MVSLIIPCFNEELYIERCLNSLLAQTYQKDDFEILIVDGMSNDKTRELIKPYCDRYAYIRLIDNPLRVTPIAMNIGIKNAVGDIIMKIDAHSVYDENYVKNSVHYLHAYKVDNIGGVLTPVFRSTTIYAQSIGLCISSRFGVGSSYFRIGSDEPRFTDTVAFGCYKRDVFDRIGLYNEKLVRGQDMELNIRLKKAGGKILLHPDIKGSYFPPDTWRSFFKHSFKNGVWAILPFKYSNVVPVSFRHLIPLLFVCVLLGSFILGLLIPPFLLVFAAVLTLYAATSFVFSLRIMLKEKRLIFLFCMPIVFFLLHAGYGLGSAWGCLKLFLFPDYSKKR